MTPSPAVLFYPKPLRALGLIRHTCTVNHTYAHGPVGTASRVLWTLARQGCLEHETGACGNCDALTRPACTPSSPPGRSERPSCSSNILPTPGHGLPTHSCYSLQTNKRASPEEGYLEPSFRNGLSCQRPDAGLDFTSKAPQGVPSPVKPSRRNETPSKKPTRRKRSKKPHLDLAAVLFEFLKRWQPLPRARWPTRPP